MNREEKRTDITIEAVKQQITLSAALIALIATLAGKGSSLLSNFEWVALPLLVSTTLGVLVLLTVPYSLYGTADPFGSPLVRIAGAGQAFFFLLGIIVIILIT